MKLTNNRTNKNKDTQVGKENAAIDNSLDKAAADTGVMLDDDELFNVAGGFNATAMGPGLARCSIW